MKRCQRCNSAFEGHDYLCFACRFDVKSTMDQITPPAPHSADTTRLKDQLGIVYPPELADALGMSVHTLQLWRQNGEGPKFIKLGKNIFYRVSDVRDWLHNNITERVRERIENKDIPSMYKMEGATALKAPYDARASVSGKSTDDVGH